MSEWQSGEEHVQRAHELFELGRWEEAEAELRKALALNPHQPDWTYNLGLTLEAAGRLEEAIEAFKSTHALDPHNHQALVSLGVNLGRIDQPTEALAALGKAVALEPSNESAYCPQIAALTMLNRHDEAEQVYYLARQIRDECPVCCAHLGESLLQRRLFEKAIWCFKEAARLDPRMPRVHARLAAAYAALGQPEQALRLYLRDLREDPGNIGTLLDLGQHLFAMDRLAEAAEKFRRILELEPANSDAHFHLGQIALKAQHYQAAALEFELVAKLNAEYPGVALNTAIVAFHTGRHDLARRHLNAVMETLTADEPDLIGLADLLHKVGLNDQALVALRLLVDREPGAAEGWHRIGVLLLKRGDYEGGIDATRQALRIDASHERANHNLLLAYIRSGRLSRARVMLRRAQKAAPHDPTIRRLAVRFQTLWLVHGIGRGLRRLIERRLGLGASHN